MLLLRAAPSRPRAPTVTESRGLRIQWTVEPQTRDFTAVCGQIFNDQRTSARNIGLMVQSVDGDKVTSRNIPNIAREIVGQSGWQFCGTVREGGVLPRDRHVRGLGQHLQPGN